MILHKTKYIIMFSSLPYEIIYNLYEYLDIEDIKKLFKSFNSEIYSKAILYNKKYILQTAFYPLEIVNSKLFSTKKFKITHIYWHKDLKLLDDLQNKICVIFDENFNSQIDFNRYSQKIYKIKYGGKFNKPVTNLPKNIKKIKFGSEYNLPFDEMDSEVTHIKFGFDFNQPVDKLPKKLTHLTFGLWFKQNININKLPQNLIYLCLFFWCGKNIDDLPDTIENLTLEPSDEITINKLPKNIKILKISECVNFSFKKSEINLQRLCTSKCGRELSLFNYKKLIINKNVRVDMSKLSLDLRTINFIDYKKSIDDLPDYIEKIKLDKCFSRVINKLPKNLKKITFDKNYKGMFLRSKLDFKNIQVKFI